MRQSLKSTITFERAALGVLILLAGTAAVSLWRDYSAHADLLWRGANFDRVGHYAFGQELALAIRSLDPVWFFGALEKAKIWPPVHGLVLSVVLAVGGIRYELGVVPSLFGWSSTGVLTGVLALKSVRSPSLGAVAAVFAVVVAWASPAFRLLGTDVMLEGLGTALSALCLLLGAQAFDRLESARTWRRLAIALTLLFFTKYNYWLLCAVTLAVLTLVSRRPARANWELLQRHWPVWRRVTIRLCRDRFVVAGGVLLLIAAVLFLRGPTVLTLFGKPVSLYPPNNLLTAAYACIFIALLRDWRRHRPDFEAYWSTATRTMAYWHLLPIAVSFLFPDRLSLFLWFIGPTHSGAGGGAPFFEGFRIYAAAFLDGFHTSPWLAGSVLALFGFGSLQYAKLTTYGRTVLIFALLCAVVVLLHPQKQGRFLTTWMFAVWIGAGIGLAHLLRLVLPGSLGRAPWWAAVCLAVLLPPLVYRKEPTLTEYGVAVRYPYGASDLRLTEAYLPLLDGQRRVAIAATFGRSELLSWTAREQCRCRRIVDQPWFTSLAPTSKQAEAALTSLIAATPAQLLVVIDAPCYRSDYQDPRIARARSDGFAAALRRQARFVLVETIPVSAHDASVSIWRRSPGAGTPGPRRE